MLAACLLSPLAAAEAAATEQTPEAILKTIAESKRTDWKRYDDYKKCVDGLVKAGKREEALAAIELFVQSPAVDDSGKTWAFTRAIGIARDLKDYARGVAYGDRAIALDRERDLYNVVREAFDCRLRLSSGDETWDWLENLANKPGLSTNVACDVMSVYGFNAYKRILPERARKALAFCRARGRRPGLYGGRWEATVRTFDKYKAFPRAEKDIAFPAAPAWFGTAKGKTVRVKDLGFNPTNMTAVIQKAIDDPEVGTLVFDKTDAPWRVSTLKPRSNQVFIFEPGVRFLSDAESQKKPPADMFHVRGVSNVVFVGRGQTPADVRLAMYADYEERKKLCRTYGGSGFTLDGAKNIAIYNLTVADCACDGLSLSGLGEINRDVYVKDVVFESNYRQASSICNVEGVYFKNVAFNDTRGNSPMCGIDVEPSIQDVQAACEMYLFDCTFKGNWGSHLNFSCSSAYPVTMYAARCDFAPNPAGNLVIMALPSIYFSAGIAAPSRIVFDDCDFRQYGDRNAIVFSNNSLFNVEFRNSRVTETGVQRKGHEKSGTPVLFNLVRTFSKSDPDLPGKVVFDGLKVTGWKDRPTLAFYDTSGTYGVTNLHGTAIHNGEKVEMSRFRHPAPEKSLAFVDDFDPAAYAPPATTADATTADAKIPLHLGFRWGGAWYEPQATYQAIYWDGKTWCTRVIDRDFKNIADLAGKPVAYAGKPREIWGNTPDNYTFPYYLNPGKGESECTLYFEVPAGGKACVLRLYGKADVCNPAGEVVGGFDWGTPEAAAGAVYVRIKPTSDKAEIWSLRLRQGVTVKFFKPLTGVFAEKPEWLPRLKAKKRFLFW